MVAISSHQAVVAGLNQTKKALLDGMAELVYIAEDADERLTHPILLLAQEKDSTIEHVATMKKLGKRLGIDTGAAVGAILKG